MSDMPAISLTVEVTVAVTPSVSETAPRSARGAVEIPLESFGMLTAVPVGGIGYFGRLVHERPPCNRGRHERVTEVQRRTTSPPVVEALPMSRYSAPQ